MSYILDLDEYTEEALKGELERRRKLSARGLCDYCRRSGDTPSCKFPDRHKAALRHAEAIELRLKADAATMGRIGTWPIADDASRTPPHGMTIGGGKCD